MMENEELCKRWLEIIEENENRWSVYLGSYSKEWLKWMKAYLRHNGILPEWMAWEPKDQDIQEILPEIFSMIDKEIETSQEVREIFAKLGKEFEQVKKE